MGIHLPQVDEGLLPDDAVQRLGYGVDPRVYWPSSFERLWPVVRGRMNAEFAAHIESEFEIGR